VSGPVLQPVLAATVVSWLWLLLEIALRVRDRRRGAGSTARDGGSRGVIVATVVPAVLLASLIGYWPSVAAATALPGATTSLWPAVVGAVVMVVGLGVRVWAISTLGASFRTTVEVDAGQAVVDRGPYRWVRHPSYSGVVLLAAGYGLATGSWLALLLTVVIPVVVLGYRIRVEERAMIETLGQRYTRYSAHTARLVPGLW
jgi:protein-S-isoprenylcysteine O-methyltransferase Ste14